jgi:hypothetical protein
MIVKHMKWLAELQKERLKSKASEDFGVDTDDAVDRIVSKKIKLNTCKY